MLKFYGYKKCDTCCKAEKFLQQENIAFEFIDITESPPALEEIAAIAKLAKLPLKKLFNTSGVQYRELKIKERLPVLADQEIFVLLSGNGRLIKRPLITDGARATIGFDEALFREIWCQ
ncbi:arsenate reductase [Nitrosomonas sp. Nm51]|uniref:Spx/MgsR family RNA polymerase-binding regulatory protein n=1 Tax=Nitrosomonas sp. Nm51 TaxID=133720 RepID=UPI0008B53502|nr:Spx/MgsR family RNA polymerase-binding regulatory protein [Nitrosomonas sp. Nm51]SER04701.1 arsenate reductase [Nitrosomonas sp. Nm51]